MHARCLSRSAVPSRSPALRPPPSVGRAACLVFLSVLVLIVATLLHLVGPHTSTAPGDGGHGAGHGGAHQDAATMATDLPAGAGETGPLVADGEAPGPCDQHGTGAAYECWGRSEGTAELRPAGLPAADPAAPIAAAHPRHALVSLLALRPPPTPPVIAPDLVRELGISRI